MKKIIESKKIRFLLILIVVLASAYIYAFVSNNYKMIKNGTTNRIDFKNSEMKLENFDIKNKKLVSNDEEASITYDFDSFQYINKLKFNYNTEENYDWNITYEYQNVYGNPETKSIDGHSNRHISIFSEPLKQKIREIKITFKSESDIVVDNMFVDNHLIMFSTNYIYYMLLFSAVFLLIYFRKYFKDHIEWVFLIIALTAGTMILSIHPIDLGKSWDDQIHLKNAYGMANKNYTEASYELSEDYLIFVQNNFSYFNTDEENKAFMEYLNKADKVKLDKKVGVKFSYNKITYLPQTFVFAAGKALNVPYSTQFTLAMYVNLILYSLIVFFAIRKTPIGKYLMLVIGLIPTSLFLASSFSYDPPITAFILLGIAYYLYEKYNSKQKLSSKNALIITTSFVIASCPKAVYAPVLLLLLMLPKEKFYSDKKNKMFKLFVLIIIGLLMSTFILPLLTNTLASDSRGGDTSVGGQLKVILKSPLSFYKVFYNFAGLQFLYKFFDISTLFNFAYLGVLANKNSYFVLLSLLFFSAIVDNKEPIDKKTKALLLIILLSIICLIWGSMYLLFTPVGATSINGVQNRYFIPLIFIFIMILYTDKVSVKISDKNLYYIYAICLSFATFMPIYYFFV